MKRRYREKEYKCGEYLDVDVFPVFDTGRATKKRRARYKATSAMQARLNQKNAERELTRVLNANFRRGDISVTLTYRDDALPSDEAEAMRDARNFLRRVARLRKKRGLAQMKYVLIIGGGRFHFHIPMSAGLSDEELIELWGKGYLNVIHFQPNESGLEGHARYIARQGEEDLFDGEDLFSMFDIDLESGEVTEREGVNAGRKKNKKRYICSRNIEHPEPVVRDGRISARRVEELATVDNATSFAFEKLYPGYIFTSCIPYYNDENGGWYLHIKMRKKREKKRDGRS